MNKQTDMDRYIHWLCQYKGTLVDDGGGGQFSGGYYEETYKLDGHIYKFAIEGEWLECIAKEIDYDA